jgi:ATP-dependent Clp protease ATP-binding subunit ClpB
MCRILARELYGSKDGMIRLDMTEFMEKHAVARLIGAPPGYVGYEEGGKLTEAVRRRPYCIVVLDEMEKAHPDVAGLLLQIMEEGVLTDSTGRKVSFQNAVVVMTCNVGGQIRSDGLGFQPSGQSVRTAEELKNRFSPEFLGRLDKVVVFHPLSRDSLKKIAAQQLNGLCVRARAGGMELELPAELADDLAGLCTAKDGARQIRHLIQDRVEEPLSVFLLQAGKRSGKIRGIWKNGQLQFT